MAAVAVAAVVIVAMGVGGGPVRAQEAEEVADDHGDTPPTATGLPLGGSLAGRIDPLFDRDFFKLDLSGRSGETDVWLYTTGELDTLLYLFSGARQSALGE